MLKQYKLRFYNFRLIIFLLAISLIGVTLVGTAASDLRSKQFAGVILGLIVMLILSLLDYSWIMNFQWIMYGFNIIMLIVVRIAGDSANGAARWIGIGSFRFQPTELSKIILIVFFAKFFMDHEETQDIFQKDIEQRFAVGRSTVTNLIQLMEKKGFVKRESVKQDARLKKVILTEKGIASQESFEDIVEHIEEELSEGISEEELHIFYKVLDRINQNVKKYEVR